MQSKTINKFKNMENRKKTQESDLILLSRAEQKSLCGGDTKFEWQFIDGEWVLVIIEDK